MSTHNPEVVGSSPASATIKTTVFQANTVVFLCRKFVAFRNSNRFDPKILTPTNPEVKIMHSTLIESVQDGAQILRQTAATFQLQFSGDAEECLCDGACDGCQGIAVTAEGNRGTNHFFEVFALQKGSDGLRDRFLTTFHMSIAGVDLIAGTTQIITKGFRNILLDLRFGATGSGQKDGCGSALCALDALGVLVRDLGSELRPP